MIAATIANLLSDTDIDGKTGIDHKDIPSSPETLREVFTTGTDPAWALLALALLVAATYIRMLSSDSYPKWTWRLYLTISVLIFATRGADVYITHQTLLLAFEIGLLLTTTLAGMVLFYFIVNSTNPPTLKEILAWFYYHLRRPPGPPR